MVNSVNCPSAPREMWAPVIGLLSLQQPLYMLFNILQLETLEACQALTSVLVKVQRQWPSA